MSSSNPNINKKLPQRLDKYIKSGSSNNTNKFSASASNNINLDQLSKAKPRPDSHNLRQKEEGFSVYLMGANEERLKNLRKKELTEKNPKNNPKNNSRSIANRKKWDLSENKSNNLNYIFNNLEIHNDNETHDNNLNVNENNVVFAANNNNNIQSRSKSRKKQELNKKTIAAHIDYKAISKLILNNNNTATSNINFNHRSNHNYEQSSKNNNFPNNNSINFNFGNLNNNNNNNNNTSTKHINSKDSITNLEEMLNDIHTVNRNITNLNKFNLNSESPVNKRRRNWGDPKYNIVFPDLSTSIEQNIGAAGLVSSKNKKRNITNYSNNVISNNNLNSSFNKIPENEVDAYNSVLGAGEYHNLNSSMAGVSKERDVYLGRANLSSASNNSNNNAYEGNSSVNYVSSKNNSKNQNLINLTYEKNSGNSSNCFNNKAPNLNNNNNNNINSYNNLISNNRENSTSTTNFKNSGSSLILSNLNQSANNALNFNKNTYSSNSNQNVNSNPDIIIDNNNNNDNSKKQNSKNFNSQNLKSLNSLSNLNSNKQITNEILYENVNSAIMTNRYWEAAGASANRKNYKLNSSNEQGKNDEVMLVLENLNNSEIFNLSNSGFNNNVNAINNYNNNNNNQQQNVNYLEQQSSLTGSTQNYNNLNPKVNSETEVKANKINFGNNNNNSNNLYNNNKKYSNIALNLNNSNTSSLNTRKFISLNSYSLKEKDRKFEELNSSSNNKSKIIQGINLNNNNNNNYNYNHNNLNTKIKLNNISNSNNNPNLINLCINNNNNNNTTERPFSSIVNLSKLKAEKLKISDLASVSGISPKNNFPSIQFIYKSPQNINLKSGQRPLSHIQKSKSTLNSKTSTNYINNNIFSNNNNNSNANVVNQMLSNPFEISHNAYNFKNTNTYSTMDRFSSREKQTSFFNNNNNKTNINTNNKTNTTNYNYHNNVVESANNNLDDNDNPNMLLIKEISNTQFNFSRKKNQYPTISNVQKLSGNNISNNNNSNNNNINNLNSVLNNLIYSRNPSTNTKNKSGIGNTSNIIESNVILSSSNYKETNNKNNNYNSKKSENNLNSNNNSANKLNNASEKKTDLLQHLEKLDEKKIKKVFKYIEKLSENNFDTSEISVLESRNFLENQGKNLDKLNINYIKTDSINFGNININVNSNNNNPNNNNVNNHTKINTTATGINNVNSVLSKASGTPNVRKESGFNNQNDSNLIKNKLLNMNNSINAGSANANYVANITQGTKSSFSASMKERNKKHQTLKDEAAYATNDKEHNGTGKNEEKKSSAIKNYSAISLLVHSNWGNMGKCGLTEIHLLDEKNRKIVIKECHVFNGSEDSISKITNNKFNTTDEKDMYISNFSGNLRIEIYFEPNTKVDKIIIWNFNAKDLSKGIREVDIVRRNKIIWKGIIQKGTNALKTDYATKIKIEKENSITNFDFINLIYKESLENFDFLSSTINSPSKSLLKSNTGITSNNNNNNYSNNNHIFNLNLQKKINVNNANSKHNSNNKLNLNKTENSSKNIFVENNLSYNNSNNNYNNNNNNNEIVIAEDFLRNSVSSVGNAKINFESLNASSSARNNPFNKLIASAGMSKNLNSNTSVNNNNKYDNTNSNTNNNLSSSQSLKNKNSQASKNINFINTNTNNNFNNEGDSNVLSNFHSDFNSNKNLENKLNSTNNLSNSGNFNNNNNNNLPNQNLTKSLSYTNTVLQNNENESETSSNNNKQNFKTSLTTKANLNSDSAFSSSNNLILVGSGRCNQKANKPENFSCNSNNNNKLNIYSLSSNNNSLIEANKKIDFFTCKRMKIILRAGYGDAENVGLTGIQFFDENEEPINIEKAKTIGALPKDVNTHLNNCGDPRIFENVFNLINETNDDNYMWLTVYNAAAPPYIEISYEDFICVSSIKFWNYNKTGELHRGVKIVDLILDEDYKNQISIVLRKGIGEDNVDYSQTITFPYKLIALTEEEIEPFQNMKPASLIYNQDFETPYLPTGFSLKLSLISNYGDPKYIGLTKMNLYDQCGNETLAKFNPKIIQLPNRIVLKTQNDNIEHCYLDPLNLISNSNSIGNNNFNNNHNVNQEYLLSSSNNKSSNMISSLIKTSGNSYKSNSNNNTANKFWITEFNDISKFEINNNPSRFNSINNFNNNNNNINYKNIENNLNMNFETLNDINNPNHLINNNNAYNPSLNTFSNFNNNENKQNLNISEYSNNQFIDKNNYLKTELNILYFIFDRPITIGFIEFINLQEKPERGIKEIEIALDENIIYKGNLKKFNVNSDKTTILFSSDNKITKLINLKTLNKANLKNGYVYKQISKPAVSLAQSEIDNNFNLNKMQTLNNKNNRIESHRNNFSPTFNMGNNINNVNNFSENENSQNANVIVHQMVLESEALKHESERLDSSEK